VEVRFWCCSDFCLRASQEIERDITSSGRFACAAARVDATALASCRSLHLCLGKLTAAATPSLLDTVVVTQRRRRVTSFAF
jgi:hypothetical protein